jgi:hypothetical protein
MYNLRLDKCFGSAIWRNHYKLYNYVDKRSFLALKISKEKDYFDGESMRLSF